MFKKKAFLLIRSNLNIKKFPFVSSYQIHKVQDLKLSVFSTNMGEKRSNVVTGLKNISEHRKGKPN